MLAALLGAVGRENKSFYFLDFLRAQEEESRNPLCGSLVVYHLASKMILPRQDMAHVHLLLLPLGSGFYLISNIDSGTGFLITMFLLFYINYIKEGYHYKTGPKVNDLWYFLK